MGEFLTALSIAARCAAGIAGVTLMLIAAVTALNRFGSR